MGIFLQTFCRWKKPYSELGPSELRRLRQFEEVNRRRKLMVAELSLGKHMLQEFLRKEV